jgi:hypothetical protein
MDGWMIAPTVGDVVAMPLSDMAKAADRSSSNGRRVKVPTAVDRLECKRQHWRADYDWQNEMTQVAKRRVARRGHPAPCWRTGQSARSSRRRENEADLVARLSRQNR